MLELQNNTSQWFLYCHNKYWRINLSDLVYIMAKDKGAAIMFKNGKVLFSSGTLETIIKQISLSHFIRCHRSYIINLSYVRTVDIKKGLVEFIIAGEKCHIPISQTYKSQVLGSLPKLISKI